MAPCAKDADLAGGAAGSNVGQLYIARPPFRRLMPTHVETLENGLKVILRPIPGMTGSTHWVEHMMFKGGGKLAKGDIDRMISRLGGKMNAFTDTDYTMYFETIPASAMDTALMIESERMRNAAF